MDLNENGISYTELMGQPTISTGKLNYQIRQLEGLVGKNERRRYVLTPLGRKALGTLSTLKA